MELMFLMCFAACFALNEPTMLGASNWENICRRLAERPCAGSSLYYYVLRMPSQTCADRHPRVTEPRKRQSRQTVALAHSQAREEDTALVFVRVYGHLCMEMQRARKQADGALWKWLDDRCHLVIHRHDQRRPHGIRRPASAKPAVCRCHQE